MSTVDATVDHGAKYNSGAPFANKTTIPVDAEFTIAAGSTNESVVSVTLLDGDGLAITQPAAFDIWLSDAATGIGLTTTSASGAVEAGTNGFDLGVHTAKKAIRACTDADGQYDLSITDTASTGFYVAVGVDAVGQTVVSRKLVSGDYGS